MAEPPLPVGGRWLALGSGLLGLIWPTRCVACGVPDVECCAECRAQLRLAEGRVLRARTTAGVPVYVAGPYAGPPRALLLACKHGGRTVFARQLGALLRAPLRDALRNAHGRTPPVLVAAPSRASRVRARGFRHVELIARAALRGWGPGSPRPRLLPGVLRALPGRRAQVGLDAAARRRNAARVAVRRAARPILWHREVILVDDIVTTGATVDGACRALEGAGARVIGVVALCLVERHGEMPRSGGGD